MLDIARRIIREDGTDRLTLAYVAECAGVSKPIAYDHFGTRTGLLDALYRYLDAQQSTALRAALAKGAYNLPQTAQLLAETYMHCSADSSGEWHAVTAALAGSNALGTVHQEVLDDYTVMFATTLADHSPLPRDELHRRCVGLIGAGEAIAVTMLAGHCTEEDAAQSFAALIEGGVS
ncbi:TetR/AcrR family transcriptional regulator [Thalassospira sp. MA62]|nr:TetR/AcrR family transcriptional regulator [Thalassospira sp. MA62]